jgi:tetratricopeptide (TPR) repeat protein
MGNRKMAETYFSKALTARRPDDFATHFAALRSMALLHRTDGKPKEAEDDLRLILDENFNASKEQRIWARRELALALGSQKGDDKHHEAMVLVEENLKTNESSVDDLLVKGVLLAAKPGSRPEAIRLLEKAFKARQPTPDQMFILASLYDEERDWPKARRWMVELLTNSAGNEKYMSYLTVFIDKLLIHDEKEQVEEYWLPRLQETIKISLETKESEFADPLATRVALATYLLTDLVRRHPQLTPKILPESDMLKASADNITDKKGKKQSLLALAEFLGNCQKLEESLKLCDEVRKELPPQEVVAVAVTAVVGNAASPEQLERVAGWVKAARQQKPDFPEWDGYLAVLRERQEDYDDAEALYRKVLDRDPKNLMAANNLAFLLGLQRKSKTKSDEALTLMQNVIDKVGPAGELLDSRGVILRAQGKLPEAEKDLREALRQQKTAYRLFHLAEILDQDAKRTKECRKVFAEAMQEGLRIEMMHMLERASYRKLLEQHNN